MRPVQAPVKKPEYQPQCQPGQRSQHHAGPGYTRSHSYGHANARQTAFVSGRRQSDELRRTTRNHVNWIKRVPLLSLQFRCDERQPMTAPLKPFAQADVCRDTL